MNGTRLVPVCWAPLWRGSAPDRWESCYTPQPHRGGFREWTEAGASPPDRPYPMPSDRLGDVFAWSGPRLVCVNCPAEGATNER